MPFETRIRELSDQLAQCRDDNQSLKLPRNSTPFSTKESSSSAKKSRDCRYLDITGNRAHKSAVDDPFQLVNRTSKVPCRKHSAVFLPGCALAILSRAMLRVSRTRRVRLESPLETATYLGSRRQEAVRRTQEISAFRIADRRETARNQKRWQRLRGADFDGGGLSRGLFMQ